MKKAASIFLLLIFLFLVFTEGINLNASSVSGIPYQTFTIGEYGRITPTQTAYIPIGVITMSGSDKPFSSPQDIFYLENRFYIADTGNARIVVLNENGETEEIIESDQLKTPTGVFVKENNLYVADKGAQAVFRIDLESNQITKTITKPTSPIYGQHNSFNPIKVAVGTNESIYIVAEGSTAGIIQVNYEGEFVGYLGINTVQFSLRDMLYQFFVKDGELASSRPPSPTNVSLGGKGSILSTNINVNETFKRLNISGVNTLHESTYYPDSRLADIWMNEEHYIYTVGEDGAVYEYDANGNLLFLFHTKDSMMTTTLGLTNKPSGIVTDTTGNLYILDSMYNNIQVYQRTVFVDLVHDAVDLYNNGRYIESKPLFEEILRQNTSFSLAHSALGSALSKEGRYEEALAEFYDAKDYIGYSDVFWEIRNASIQKNLMIWLIVLVCAFVIIKISLKAFRLSLAYGKYLAFKEKAMNQTFVSQLLLALRICKKPSDVVYSVKRKNKAGIPAALFVFALFLTIYAISIYATGFLFRAPFFGDLLIELVTVTAVFFLFVIINYLVSTFSDGEGRLRDVFIISCFALIPFIIFRIPIILLSHVLTYNEVFIYDLSIQALNFYTIALLIYTIKEVHNYSFWETVKSVILIIFGIVIVILMGLLIYSFIGQLIDFISSVIKEVIYRV